MWIILLILWLGIANCVNVVTGDPCIRMNTNSSNPLEFVCVCNSTVCHSIPPIGKIAKGQAILFETTKSGKRLEKRIVKRAERKEATVPQCSFSLDSTNQYQTIIGFGGAITDAVAININKMKDEEMQSQLIQSYFGDEGLQYNLIRIPIASCDFSTREYSYLEKENDFELSTFHLVEEDIWKMKYIQMAKKISRRDIKIFASPWSAPAWMKTNNRMKGGGKLKKGYKYRKTWAKYFVRFLEDYFYQGVPIWGVTIQNEPSTGSDPEYAFQTMYMPPQAQSDFISQFLSPILRNSSIANNTILMIHDDFRGNLPEWADETLFSPITNSLVSGIAVHWYGSTGVQPERLSETKKRHPDKFILATEACAYDKEYRVRLGSFERGEWYARDIMEDLQHDVSGWVDWNIVLDTEGGPNWVSNFVDSPIIFNKTSNVFYKQPMYYAMGHFSKFLQPGARRIELRRNFDCSIQGISFQNPDGTTTTVLQNPTETKVTVTLKDEAEKEIVFDIEPRSINTIVYDEL